MEMYDVTLSSLLQYYIYIKRFIDVSFVATELGIECGNKAKV